jgi:hypothetical protein
MARNCDHCHTPIDGARVTLAAVYWPSLTGMFAPLTEQGDTPLPERVAAFQEEVAEQRDLGRSIAFSLDLHPDCFLAHYQLRPRPLDAEPDNRV